MLTGWPRLNTTGVLLGYVLPLALVGCQGLRPGPRQQAVRSNSALGDWPLLRPDTARAHRDRDAIVVVQMQFDVLRIELPAATVHHSEKTWNHVDELSGDPAHTALLRRNGFRMGTATPDAWPALRAAFEACNAKVTRATHVVQHGLPLTLDLGPVVGSETVFLLTPDDRLVGTTFDRGNKYLHLDYAMDPRSGNSTTIQMTPEIHRQSLTRRWRHGGGGLRQVSDYQGKVFRQLSNAVEVAVGEFLVVGPDTKATSLSVGHRFLTRTLQGREYETILCITPQPFRTEVARR